MVVSNAMYNPDEPVGRVRLLIDDTDDTSAVFTDRELVSFLDLNRQSILRAAAQALLMIAGSEARLSKKIRTQDLSTDGPAVAAELRAQAKQLRSQAAEEEAEAPEASFFGVVEYPYTTTGRPELTEPSPW